MFGSCTHVKIHIVSNVVQNPAAGFKLLTVVAIWRIDLPTKAKKKNTAA